MWQIILIIALFILGLVYLIQHPCKKEGFEGFTNEACPNLLIKKGDKYYLYNKRKVEVPGVNPIQFDHLDEYVQFMDWLRSQGIRCPILYLEEEYDTQNNRGYAVHPDPWGSSKSGSKTKFYPANADHVEVNPNKAAAAPGFDPQDQEIGVENATDEKFHSDEAISAYPTDPQWGGPKYSQQQVKEGKFVGDYVYKRHPKN